MLPRASPPAGRARALPVPAVKLIAFPRMANAPRDERPLPVPPGSRLYWSESLVSLVSSVSLVSLVVLPVETPDELPVELPADAPAEPPPGLPVEDEAGIWPKPVALL